MSSKFVASEGYQIIHSWLQSHEREPFDFQKKTWLQFSRNKSGLLVAPTGFGKTYAVFLAVLIDYFNHPNHYKRGLKLLWISPLRSLAKDLAKAMAEAIEDIGLDWVVGVRNGDTPTNIRRQQERLMPDILITTPETLHLLFSQKNNSRFFRSLLAVAVDEWHELLGNKRGVLVELALARLRVLSPPLRTWGITATIGNLEEASQVFNYDQNGTVIIKSKLRKKLQIETVLPNEIEVLPWAGHLGKQMADKIIPIIYAHQTTLIFTNTRGQSELWYQLLLDLEPDLAGQIAIHHGSIDKKLRNWIEDALVTGELRAVVCTSSLDLGVDFKPVDCVIQIGSAKGIARFMQRAGRSGHSPYETSKIYFIPTHSLEIVEAAALIAAVKSNSLEDRQPVVMAFDMLVQFLITLAVGEGFKAKEAYEIIKSTYAFQFITDEDWLWALHFITKGGETLSTYEEFHKVIKDENEIYKVKSRRISMLHRMNIGVIVSDAMLRVKFKSGGYIGMIEEYFVSKLKPQDSFVLAGRTLKLDRIKEMTAYVKSSKSKNAITPSWLGGRLPLTSYMSRFLREKLSDALNANARDKELNFLSPLLQRQNEYSHIPKGDEFLIEYISTKDGYHLFMYPFEGRLVHEVIAALMAYRLSKIKPMTFTIAMNDYGFELLSDQPIPTDAQTIAGLLSSENLMNDVIGSVNAAEMASRKFRDIAVIAGLVVQSSPGKRKNNKSLQSSSGLIFRVLEENEPNNLLVKQAYAEVFDQQIEEVRLRKAFERINESTLILKEAKSFTPLSFPIKVDSLRAALSSEKLEARIRRIQREVYKAS